MEIGNENLLINQFNDNDKTIRRHDYDYYTQEGRSNDNKNVNSC